MFGPKIGLLGKIDVLKGLQWVEKRGVWVENGAFREN